MPVILETSVEIDIEACFLIQDEVSRPLVCRANRAPKFVRWTEHSGEEPITVNSLGDGSWPIDLIVSSNDEADTYLYWVYPFDTRVHIWYLDSNGYRLGGRDLNDDEYLEYVSKKAATEPLFVYRLYETLRRTIHWRSVYVLRPQITQLLESGSIEAAYFVCKFAEDFDNHAIRCAVQKCQTYFQILTNPLVYPKLRPRELAEITLISKLPRIAMNREEAFEWQKMDDYATLRRSLPWLEAAGGSCILTPQLEDITVAPPLTAHDLLVKMKLDLRSAPVWNFEYGPIQGAPRDRLIDSIGLMDAIGYSLLKSVSLDQLEKLPPFFIEAGDMAVNQSGVLSYERTFGNSLITLIPDVYFFNTFGYRWTKAQTYLPWSERKVCAIWRGSTTGFEFDESTVDELPRVKLCMAGLAFPALMDFGITNIYQTRDSYMKKVVEDEFKQRGIFKDFIKPYTMSNYRFIVDIDGNSNSWGFLEKLIYGSCVLKVDSPYEQWFYSEIKPWEHYVPVKEDLTDLAEILNWCLSNDNEAEAIGARGREFALGLDFQSELNRIGRTMLAGSR